LFIGHSTTLKGSVHIVEKPHNLLVGIDEAGRGPLAGPVVSAAVIIEQKVDGVKDSKRLSAPKREALYNLIIKESIAFGIGVASPKEIDKINILKATLLSMRRAVESMKFDYLYKHGKPIKEAMIFVDGNRIIPEIRFPQKAVIGGDRKIYEISAASIIAKVTRDRMMKAFSKRYPDYGFERHKGYATLLHREMIKKFGVSDIHRRSFLRKLNEENSLW
jgi:ribonuclease HII